MPPVVSVNGIAFAGDYLSAASFLGICGMIAVSGYDGFLYSIGYLAGWIVALFVVAEPIKRLGKFTFTDALDAKFNSRGIKLMAAISTLVVSLFYLIPQMVGAGALITPLLAKSFGILLFAIISATAFATILGTVSGLIVASSGAVAHDLMDRFMGLKMSDHKKVLAGKITAVGVGIIAMILGILFQGMNVSYLVGWAFSVAASANLPAILMLLFWKKTTAKGIIASISTGLVSALGLILLCQKTFNEVYNISNVTAPIQLNNPAIISVPLSFIVLIAISLLTQPKNKGIEGAVLVGKQENVL